MTGKTIICKDIRLEDKSVICKDIRLFSKKGSMGFLDWEKDNMG
jgi:hypothetical protein